MNKMATNSVIMVTRSGLPVGIQRNFESQVSNTAKHPLQDVKSNVIPTLTSIHCFFCEFIIKKYSYVYF